MLSEPQPSNTSSVILIHWEPEGYARYPSGREREIISEVVAATLTHNEVFAKDTDLILNRRIIDALSEPVTFSTFAEFVKAGLVRVLMRPLTIDIANSGLSDEQNPILRRARNIRTLGAQRFEPNDRDLAFYSRLDKLLCETPGSWRLVEPYPESTNPFALWLARVLEQSDRLRMIPDFAGIDDRMANEFIGYCREPGAWFKYYSDVAPELIRPGDEDGKFFRSQAYRSLVHFGHGDCSGMKNLLQSVFNACYCYWEGSVGTYESGFLLEPPRLFEGAREHVTAVPTISEVVKTEVDVSPRLAELVCQVRRNSTHAFDNLQRAMSQMNHSGVEERAMRDAIQELAQEFSLGADKLKLLPTGLDSPAWRTSWSLVALASGAAWALSFVPVVSGLICAGTATAVCAPSAIEWLRQQRSATRLRDALGFRMSTCDVPDEVVRLRSETARA